MPKPHIQGESFLSSVFLLRGAHVAIFHVKDNVAQRSGLALRCNQITAATLRAGSKKPTKNLFTSTFSFSSIRCNRLLPGHCQIEYTVIRKCRNNATRANTVSQVLRDPCKIQRPWFVREECMTNVRRWEMPGKNGQKNLSVQPCYTSFSRGLASRTVFFA